MGLVNNLVGLFVGQSSKKRQIGLGIALGLSVFYYANIIDVELFKALMGLDVIFVGAAFSAKWTKLQKAVVNAKK